MIPQLRYEKETTEFNLEIPCKSEPLVKAADIIIKSIRDRIILTEVISILKRKLSSLEKAPNFEMQCI